MSEWQPIESAPLHTEIALYHPQNGRFVGQHTSLDGNMSDQEIEEIYASDGMPEGFEYEFQWWAYTFSEGAVMLEGDEIPTLWQPLPTPPNQHQQQEGDNA